MNESSKDAKKLGDIVVDYVTKKKLSKLENAFKNNPAVMNRIKDYSKAHDNWMSAHDKLMDAINKMCSKQKCDTDLK